MEFILAVVVGILCYGFIRLQSHIEQLEERIRRFETTPVRRAEATHSFAATEYETDVPPPVTEETVYEKPVPLPVPPPSPVTPVPLPYAPTAFQNESASEFFLVTWFKEQTLIKVGALIFFLGAVWFVSYSISQGWIPVSVRIALGLLVAIGFYSAALWRRATEPQQYLVLTTLGTGIVLVTVFSAQFFFGLFPAPIALAIMVASIAYTVLVSVRTMTEWLAIVSALAGLSAPFLIGTTSSDATVFMMYLLALAASFSTVVFFTHWRTLSIVLVSAVSFFELLCVHEMSDSAAWFFMILFAGLFVATTSVSLYRSATPEAADIVLLTLVGLVYTYGAHTFAFMPGVALIIAALLLAGIGYTLSGMSAPKRVIAVYICFSSAAWLIGTSMIFSGYSQLLALTVEITVAFLIVTDLRFSARAVYLALLTFLGLVISAEPVLYSAAWRNGIWQLDALSSVVLCLALLGSVAWILERPLLRAEAWALSVASTLGLVGFLYTLLLLAQISDSTVAARGAFTTVLWIGFIFTSLYYVLHARLTNTWVTVVCTAVLFPVLPSVYAFMMPDTSTPDWKNGVLDPYAIATYVVFIFLCFSTALLGIYYRETARPWYRLLASIFGISSVAYGFMVIAMFWGTLFTAGVAGVLTYSSYALVLYGLSIYCWQRRSPFPAVYGVTIAGILPVALSVSSMNIYAWKGSVLQPHAAGLYVMTTLILVSALRFFMYQTDNQEVRAQVRTYGITLMSIAGIYGVILVWLVTHILSASDGMAVTIALFIYTVAGLGLYVAGSSRGVLHIKYAGMVLLAVVVVRLGIVEVWVMDIIWRIVTFLGIGLLFMLAALLEKKKPN